jgi:monoamine oxidase
MAKSPLVRTLLWAHRQIAGARMTGMPVNEFIDKAKEVRRNRRDFLKNCAGVAAATAGLSALPQQAFAATSTVIQPTVAIIGGGMAGLNCARVLKKKGVNATIYEASNRVTGRIFTDRTTFAAQNMFADLGGEYIDTGHTYMRRLAQKYGLTLYDYQLDDAQIDPYYDFGGVSRTVAQVLDAYAPIAAAIDSANEQFTDPDGTVMFNNPNGGEYLDSLSIRAFLATVTAEDWIKKLIEVAYETEFGLDSDVNNVINLLYYISTNVKKMKKNGVFDVFGASDERFHCAQGNDAIPQAMANTLTNQIQLDKNLQSIALRSDGKYVLTFADSTVVIADHVVSAIPFTILRQLDLSGLALPSWKAHAINHMGYGNITKIFTGHTTPIWRAQGYVGNILTDQAFQSTTETSRMQPGTTGIIENYTAGSNALLVAKGNVPSQVTHFHSQAERIFPGLTASYNGRKVRKAWSRNPYSKAAYSSYTVGQYTTIAGAEPIRVGNLHFCGEHTTIDYQGWMEGAARTGADVANEILADLNMIPAVSRINGRPGTAALMANG